MSGEIQIRNYIKYTMCNVTILHDVQYYTSDKDRVIICRVPDMTDRRTMLYYRGNHFSVFTSSVWKSGYKFILF
jgi:hypothetical protein